MPLSVATPTTWEDDTEFEAVGTFPTHLNGWGSFNARWGIFDLKAPDNNYPGSSFRFINLSPSIPPKSRIQAAVITGAAQDTQSGTLDAFIEIVAKDGKWNVEPKISTPRWLAYSHGTYPLHMCVEARTTGAALLTAAALAPGVEDVINLRQWGNTTPASPARTQAMAQALTSTTAGTLGSVSWRIRRTGTRSGNLVVRVYSVGAGLPFALLATSDSRSFNSIGTASSPTALESFTFSGANQISIPNATQLIYSLETDYTTPDLTNVIQMVCASVALSGGYPLMYGEARGLGPGNYLIGQQPLDLPLVTGSPSVAWSMPNFTVNTVYTTPDIKSLIQAYVNDSGYAQGDPFLLRIRRAGTSQLKNRGFKTWESPDTPGTVQYVTLVVAWRPRIVRSH